jgi:hypothetical protein
VTGTASALCRHSVANLYSAYAARTELKSCELLTTTSAGLSPAGDSGDTGSIYLEKGHAMIWGTPLFHFCPSMHLQDAGLSLVVSTRACAAGRW